MLLIMKKSYITPHIGIIQISTSAMIAASLEGTSLDGHSYGGDVNDGSQQPTAASRGNTLWDDSWE